MWVKSEDYSYFAKNCEITYFNYDISKLIDELFDEDPHISGITCDNLNDKCMSIYDSFVKACPHDISFDDYVRHELPKNYPKAIVLQDVLIAIHNTFLE